MVQYLHHNRIDTFLLPHRPLKEKRNVYLERAKNEWRNSQLPIIDKIGASGVDFTKWGWKKKISKIIGIRHQKLKDWLIRIEPIWSPPSESN